MRLNKQSLMSVSYVLFSILLTYPLLIGSSYEDFQNPPVFVYYMQILGVCSFIGAILLLNGQRIIQRILSKQVNRYQFLLFVFLFISIFSLFSNDVITSLIYSILTFLVFISSGFIWAMPMNKIKMVFLYYSMCLLLFYIIALFLKGIDDRMIGMIHPNYMGVLSFCMLGSYCLSTLKWRVPMMCIAMLISLSISSRIGMVSISIFSTVLLLGGVIKSASVSKLLKFFCVLTFIISVVLGSVFLKKEAVFTDFIGSSLKLHSVDRGIGSGFTGRSTAWSNGVEAIAEKPFLGYGFRASKLRGAHNGYINLLIDTGLVFGALLLGFVAYSIVMAGINFVTLKDDYGRDKSLVIFAMLLGYTVSWFLEPAHFYIGLFYSILYMTLLISPYTTIYRSEK